MKSQTKHLHDVNVSCCSQQNADNMTLTEQIMCYVGSVGRQIVCSQSSTRGRKVWQFQHDGGVALSLLVVFSYHVKTV